MRRRKVLPGLAITSKRLADGSIQKYVYAWRGGPLLKSDDGEPLRVGDPQLVVAYAAAHQGRHRSVGAGTMFSLIVAFKSSSEYKTLALRTRKDYLRFLDLIEQRFGTLPIAALQLPKARGLFKTWRDEIAAAPAITYDQRMALRRAGKPPHLAGNRQADYVWGMLSRVLAVAKDRGTITTNVCERGGRLYSVDRAEIIWLPAHITAFDKVASEPLRFALAIAKWTAQRQGDLIKITWSQYDGTHIRLQQGKTGARVAVRISADLKAALDARRPDNADGPILRNTHGKPWTTDGFKTSWGKAATKAGLAGIVRFHDLRGTAVTELSNAGCTNQEIAAITGHSEKDIERIMGAYRGGRIQLGDQAMTKREANLNGT